jgi:hypothetical protein
MAGVWHQNKCFIHVLAVSTLLHLLSLFWLHACATALSVRTPVVDVSVRTPLQVLHPCAQLWRIVHTHLWRTAHAHTHTHAHTYTYAWGGLIHGRTCVWLISAHLLEWLRKERHPQLQDKQAQRTLARPHHLVLLPSQKRRPDVITSCVSCSAGRLGRSGEVGDVGEGFVLRSWERWIVSRLLWWGLWEWVFRKWKWWWWMVCGQPCLHNTLPHPSILCSWLRLLVIWRICGVMEEGLFSEVGRSRDAARLMIWERYHGLLRATWESPQMNKQSSFSRGGTLRPKMGMLFACS